MAINPETASDLVGKLLDSEPVKELLGPASREVGIFLGDVANMFRFYATENLEKIGRKWARNRQQEERTKGQVLEVVEFQRVMPLLTAASLVADDELQERWAALLESAATADSNYLPSFGQTLAQLSADEARFLDRLWAFLIQSSKIGSKYPRGMEPVSEKRLVYVYDSTIFSELGERAELLLEQVQLRDVGPVLRARLLINDLLRLGILGEVQTVEQEKVRDVNDAFRRVPPSSINQALASIPPPGRSHLRTQYALTRYGISFIQAVSLKTPTST